MMTESAGEGRFVDNEPESDVPGEAEYDRVSSCALRDNLVRPFVSEPTCVGWK